MPASVPMGRRLGRSLTSDARRAAQDFRREGHGRTGRSARTVEDAEGPRPPRRGDGDAHRPAGALDLRPVRHVKQIVDAKAQFRLLAEPWADTGTSTGLLPL